MNPVRKQDNELPLTEGWGERGLMNDLRKLLCKHPQAIASKYGLTIIQIFQNDFDEAIKSLNAILNGNPKETLIHRRLGEMYILCSKYQEAIPHLEKAIESDPQDLTALTWLSLIYYRIGETEKAITKQDILEESVLSLSVSCNYP